MGTCLGRKTEDTVLQDPQDFAPIKHWAKIHPRPSALKRALESEREADRDIAETEMVRLLPPTRHASLPKAGFEEDTNTTPLIRATTIPVAGKGCPRPPEPSYKAPRLPSDPSQPKACTCLQMLMMMQEETHGQTQATSQAQTQSPTAFPRATPPSPPRNKASPVPPPKFSAAAAATKRPLSSPPQYLSVASARGSVLLGEMPERSCSFSTSSDIVMTEVGEMAASPSRPEPLLKSFRTKNSLSTRQKYSDVAEPLLLKSRREGLRNSQQQQDPMLTS